MIRFVNCHNKKAEVKIFDGENIYNCIQKIRSCFQGNCDSRETKRQQKKKKKSYSKLIVLNNLLTPPPLPTCLVKVMWKAYLREDSTTCNLNSVVL